MELTFRFLHLLGAIAVGYYILLPMMAGSALKLKGAGREGYLSSLITLNRVGQYIFILQFITGGYLISKGDYSVLWMVLVIVVFVAIAALAGIMSKPLKRMKAAAANSEGQADESGKIRIFSLLIAIGFIALVVLMFNPF